jgi:hypothetical protein
MASLGQVPNGKGSTRFNAEYRQWVPERKALI